MNLKFGGGYVFDFFNYYYFYYIPISKQQRSSC